MVLAAASVGAQGLFLRMVDVGMAECIVVSADDQVMMVDTAYAKNGEAVRRALEAMNVRGIQYLVLTHPHADHIGGAQKIIADYPVACAVMPPIEHSTKTFNDTIRLLKEKNTALLYPQVGDTFMLGGAKVTVYGPHPVAYSSLNDYSIVLMLEYAGRRVLLTGDIEESAERDLLAFDDVLPLRADVLKVAHHGAQTSSLYAFVQAVSPAYALISCNSDESDLYPHVETAMTLVECGAEQLLTTEMCGDIQLYISPDGQILVL